MRDQTNRTRIRPGATKALFDLRFLELDVLARDRVVLPQAQLLGLRARVLLGHIEKARVGAADELDLDGCRLGHRTIPGSEKRKAACRRPCRPAQWPKRPFLSTDTAL